MSAQTIPFVVIPCGGSKLETAAPAAELYTGSMFKDALNTARTMTTDDNIRILSALHGLIKLSDIVAPYDVKMGDADSITNDKLRRQVEWLIDENGTVDHEIHTLLPRRYYDSIWAAVHTVNRRHTFPMRNHFAGCAGIGYQKAALKALRTESLNKKEGF